MSPRGPSRSRPDTLAISDSPTSSTATYTTTPPPPLPHRSRRPLDIGERDIALRRVLNRRLSGMTFRHSVFPMR
jgi:hypothetical protein